MALKRESHTETTTADLVLLRRGFRGEPEGNKGALCTFPTIKCTSQAGDFHVKHMNINNRKFPKDSVCKPCWELKYCPYGHIVEHFPLLHTTDNLESFDTTERYKEVVEQISNLEKISVEAIHEFARLLDILNPESNQYISQFNPEDVACRVFGHTCPVFFAQSGYTETKEGRREGRYIPRKIMLKVVRRDNHICQSCRSYVMDDEIEFDHIIPISRGGPTTVDNLRLLCKTCNRKKSNTLNEILNV